MPASIWTAPRLLELNLLNNQICELNSSDYRRNHQYGCTRQQVGASAARISRHKQRQDQQKAAEEIQLLRDLQTKIISFLVLHHIKKDKVV